MQPLHSTTVLGVIHNGKAAMGADGQATMGTTIVKATVKKIRKIAEGKVLAGFAGATADAFTLLDRFEGKLEQYNGNLKRAAIELAKDWRMDRVLRRLEAMLAVMNKEEMLLISGTGDVIEPDNNIVAIGSGAMYAQAAATALIHHASKLSAEEIVKEAMNIAGDICIYTNKNIEVLTI